MTRLSELDVRHKKQKTAPEFARCPHCGSWSPLNEIRSRFFWLPDLQHETVMEHQGGCYLCPACPPGERWFALLPGEYNTPAQDSQRSGREPRLSADGWRFAQAHRDWRCGLPISLS